MRHSQLLDHIARKYVVGIDGDPNDPVAESTKIEEDDGVVLRGVIMLLHHRYCRVHPFPTPIQPQGALRWHPDPDLVLGPLEKLARSGQRRVGVVARDRSDELPVLGLEGQMRGWQVPNMWRVGVP